ncbi:MAG: hypothetical protein JRF63_08275 [Deltaproteobacteria bacterium]|nr:hypothetical protein [Deltaproteobacteria bacterium]
MFNIQSLTLEIIIIFAATSQLAASCSSEPKSPEPRPELKAGNSDTEGSGTASSTAATMVFEGPGALLQRQVGDWKISSPPRYFGPENLYDLINGGAEIYTEFGLKKMVTTDYKAPGKKTQTVTVEVYDMGSAEGAFGRTARFLEGLADPSDAGAGLPAELVDLGILGVGDLIFWKGKYMGHMTLLEEDPAVDIAAIAKAGKEILPVFAADVASRIAGPAAIPTVFARFPAEGRLGRSEAWFPNNVLGIDGLGAGYAVRYAKGEIAWTAFATKRFADEKSAEAAWKSVKSAGADGRRFAIKVAGERVVGLVQTDEPRLDDTAAEAFAESMQKGFSSQ